MICREDILENLIKAKISSPRLETDIILKYAAPRYPEMTELEQKKILEMLKRRINHEPLDKIIGQKEFYKYTFKVSQDVLSPRPDTEILLENALAISLTEKITHILDLGTGSGCILLSLLKELPAATGIGVDISKEALAIAKQNARMLEISNRVQFINSDWNKLSLTFESVDMIVSNPPYIKSTEIKSLEKEVKDYDPLLALDGGADGLNCYRDIAFLAPKLLKKGGYILLEVGYNQAKEVGEIFKYQGFKHVKTAKDLANIDRCVILRK